MQIRSGVLSSQRVAQLECAPSPDAMVEDGDCASYWSLLDHIGTKWSILVIPILSGRPTRFTEIKRAIPGVSGKMLTSTLRALQRDGIVTRTALGGMPPRVDYALTLLGRSLVAPLSALTHWAHSNRRAVEAARQSYHQTGEGLLWAVIEGQDLAQGMGNGASILAMRRHGFGLFAGERAGDQGAAHALMDKQDVLAVAGKGHQVGFPVVWTDIGSQRRSMS